MPLLAVMDAEHVVPVLIVIIFIAVAGFGGMLLLVALQGKGTATKTELHQEGDRLEDQLNARFEAERAVARTANGRLHSRIDDVAVSVAKIEGKLDVLISNRSEGGDGGGS